MIIIHKIFRRISYILTRLYLKIFRFSIRKLKYNEGKTNVIVSLTTYNPRFKMVPRSIESLLLQFDRPNKIIVWLDEDVDIDKLPEDMRALTKYGVEYAHISDDMRPHKKYLEVFDKYPNDLIVTADDDLLYSPFVIGSLLKVHKQYPEAVCARRVHKMVKDEHGNIAKYLDWEGEYRRLRTPSNSLLSTGGAGTLYPPGCLPKEAFNRESIKKLCLSADDIWLKCMMLLKGTKVVWAPCIEEMPDMLEKSHEGSLMAQNVEESMNDVCIRQVMEYYNIPADSIDD